MAMVKLSADELRRHKGVSFTGITTVFFCYDGEGRLFLAKRSKKARDEHGRWDVGGGGLKHGQTLEQNVRRELMEEYAVAPLKVDFIGYREVFRQLEDGTPTHWIAMDFAVRVDPAQVKISEPDMFDDSGWFLPGEFPAPLHSQLGIAMEKYGDAITALRAS